MIDRSNYFQTLIKDVMDNSESEYWEDAVTEWEIVDVEEDERLEESCICGKEHLRYLFTIKNQLNGNELYPIGSSCIKKFERDDLKHLVDVREQLFKLLHAVEDNQYLQLSSDFFSRKLLRYLLDIGAFEPNQWNNYNPEMIIDSCLICLIKEQELINRIRRPQQLFLVQLNHSFK